MSISGAVSFSNANVHMWPVFPAQGVYARSITAPPMASIGDENARCAPAFSNRVGAVSCSSGATSQAPVQINV